MYRGPHAGYIIGVDGDHIPRDILAGERDGIGLEHEGLIPDADNGGIDPDTGSGQNVRIVSRYVSEQFSSRNIGSLPMGRVDHSLPSLSMYAYALWLWMLS